MSSHSKRGAGGLGVSSVEQFWQRERERETGGWAQFDWMLDGGSLKAQPIGSHLVCFKKIPIDVSQKLLIFVLQIQ
jgi:hypothetical protein